MKFSFLFKSLETTTTTTSAAASWPWPSCATNSKTLSFRADADIIHKTISPDNKNNTEKEISHHHHHYLHIQYDDHDEIKPEITIKGLRSERFFFEPGKSNSILEEAKKQSVTKLETIESRDPISDFRVSMEEMVEANGLKNWESLEKLLAWYLRVNEKNNHGYIIRAFVDMLFSDQASCFVDCSSSSSATHEYSFTSPLSFSSSSTHSSSPSFNLFNSMENKDEMIPVDDNNGSSDSSSFLGNASSSSGV